MFLELTRSWGDSNFRLGSGTLLWCRGPVVELTSKMFEYIFDPEDRYGMDLRSGCLCHSNYLHIPKFDDLNTITQ